MRFNRVALVCCMAALTAIPAALAGPSTKQQSFPPKTAQVLCCCRVMGGGSCCAQASFCGGYVPGCICSFRWDEAPSLTRIEIPQLSFDRRK